MVGVAVAVAVGGWLYRVAVEVAVERQGVEGREGGAGGGGGWWERLERWRVARAVEQAVEGQRVQAEREAQRDAERAERDRLARAERVVARAERDRLREAEREAAFAARPGSGARRRQR